MVYEAQEFTILFLCFLFHPVFVIVSSARVPWEQDPQVVK